ncbi:MFS transporter [Modestobacter sp. Leaf380]|uniref:MFS transporter n=1 Tax=Modestobacter sp. Leaf380 TaxID=1736356 RepID=UPI0006F80FCF|nr:MFS transporter [Modestobacter sp. Leaf380]KQS73250.1 MFS transporter [Modestobacter sp. Leaf380]
MSSGGGAGVFDRTHRLTTAGLLVLITFVAFESMAVSTAMPTVVRELDGLAWYAWPFTAFLVAQVVGMVLGGDVSDRRGARVALLWGVGFFSLGLLASGTAADMALFVGGRAVQGLGGGLITVSLYVVAGQAYEAALRSRLFGTFAAAWVLPALFGPLVAGAVTTHTSWRWVFLGILPLVAVGLLLVLPSIARLAVPDGTARPPVSRRWWALLAGVGIGALQYAGQRLDLLALGVAVVGVVALAAGLRPLLPRGTVLARRGMPTVVASRGLLAGSFFGIDTLLPLTLTEVHGFDATTAGIPLTTGAIGWSLASALSGRRPDLSRVRLLQAGFVLLAVGLAGTAFAALPGTGGWTAYLSWAVAGLGMGLGMPSLSVLLLEQSPEHRRGADSASLQISDVVGSALCVGLGGVLVAAAAVGVLSLTTALLIAIAVFSALALLGSLIAGRAAAPTVSSPRATTLATS